MSIRPSLTEFCTTREGAEYMRQLMPAFLEVSGLSLADVAYLLHNEGARPYPRTVKGIEREDELRTKRTAAALARWIGSESPLYKNNNRGLTLLRRLLALMLRYEDIRVLIERQVHTEIRSKLIEGLTDFFYRGDPGLGDTPEIRLQRSRLVGLHKVLTPYSIPEYGSVGPRSRGWFLHFDGDADRYALIVNLFMLSGPTTEENNNIVYDMDGIRGLRERQSGYAFVVPDGSIHSLLADRGPRQARYYATWGAYNSLKDRIGSALVEGDILLTHTVNPMYRSAVHLGDLGVEQILRRPDPLEERRIHTVLQHTKWSTGI